MAVLASLVVVGALLFVVIGQTIVASQQVRLDNLRQQLSTSTAANENLELEQAQLSSPPQVLDIAQHRLGMVAPSGVTYLSPAPAGPTVAEAAAGRR
jgi:cell division protein FtsL